MAKTFKDLSPAELSVFAQRVAASNLTKTAQRRLLAIVDASLKPDDERTDEDLSTLPDTQLLTIGQSMARTVNQGKSILERGMAELDAISDAEWNRLIREADRE